METAEKSAASNPTLQGAKPAPTKGNEDENVDKVVLKLKNDLSGYFLHGFRDCKEDNILIYDEKIIQEAIDLGKQDVEVIQISELLKRGFGTLQEEALQEEAKQFLSESGNLGLHLLMIHIFAGKDEKGFWMWPEASPAMTTLKNVNQLFNKGDKSGSIQKIMSSREYHSLLGNLVLPYCLKTSSGQGGKVVHNDGSHDESMKIINGFSGVKDNNENRDTVEDVCCDGEVTLNELNDFASIMLVSANSYCTRD